MPSSQPFPLPPNIINTWGLQIISLYDTIGPGRVDDEKCSFFLDFDYQIIHIIHEIDSLLYPEGDSAVWAIYWKQVNLTMV